MKLSSPKKNTFYVAVALAVLAVLSTFIAIPLVSGYAFWILVIGFVVLALGNTMSGF